MENVRCKQQLAKAALVHLRVAEKQRELVPQRISMRSSMALPGSSSRTWAALAARVPMIWRCGTRSTSWCMSSRKEMAKVALEMADKCGEPPLGEQV